MSDRASERQIFQSYSTFFKLISNHNSDPYWMNTAHDHQARRWNCRNVVPFYLTQFLAKLVDDSPGPQTNSNFVQFFPTNTIAFRTNMWVSWGREKKLGHASFTSKSKRVAHTYSSSTVKCFIPLRYYVALASRQHKQTPFGVTFIYFGWKQSSNCRLRCPRQTQSEWVLEM